MASSWLDDFVSTLNIRDSREKANEALYSSYARLADHSAANSQTEPASVPASAPTLDLSDRTKAQRTTTSTASNTNKEDNLTGLRADLAASQRTIATLNNQVTNLNAEITALNSSLSECQQDTKQLRKQIAALEGNRASLLRKLKDREEELKEQRKLAQNVQDEMMGLEMQLNVAESQKKEKERENEELIARWMKRMGQEADEVNKGSGW